MSKRKKGGVKAAEAIGKLAAVAVLGAAAFGAYKLFSWSRDEYATALWIPSRGKGVRITKGPEKNTYLVQTGYRWQDDAPAEDLDEEAELEIPLNELQDPEAEDGLER